MTFASLDEKRIGAFAVRRLAPRYLIIGLAVSIGLHAVAIGAYYVAGYLSSRTEAPPTRVVYFDPSNLGPPPAMSRGPAAPGSFGGGEYKSKGPGKPELPPEAELGSGPELTQNIVPTLEWTPNLNRGGGGSSGVGFGGGSGTGRGGGRGEGGTASLGKYTPPTPLVMTWPDYPASARKRGIRGKVVVRVHVTAEGTVDRAEVVSGLEDPTCRAAAIDAALKLKFMPALVGGKPVDAWFAYLVEFGKKR